MYKKLLFRLTPLVIPFLLVMVFSCSSNNSKPLFSKMPASKTGIHFKNVNVENKDYNVFVYEYFYNGGGVALGDINNDGLVDIYLSANQISNKLYLNKGNFEFEDITEKSGTAAADGWKTGVSMVDINADGLLDIYVCRSAANETEHRRNSLFINKGDLTFEDQSKVYGLDDDSYSTHAAFLDFDRDGDVDVFLLNHSVSRIVRNYDIRTEDKMERVPYVGNKLFQNRGGKFVDVSDSVGIYGPAHNYGLGVCYSDINDDGWLDIYTSNDYTGADYLLINEKGKFTDKAGDHLSHISRFSMGVDIADVNNDGRPDIFTLDMLPDNNKRQKELFWPDQYDTYTEMVKNGLHHQFMRNMLHLNYGVGKFSEVGQLAGISNTDWSWSALFADFDNDGFQDLFVSNGYKRDYTNNDFLKYRADQMIKKGGGRANEDPVDLMEKMPSTKLTNYLFKNRDGIHFSDSTHDWGLSEEGFTHGAAYADLDNDGDLDLVLNNMDDEVGVYRNNSELFKKKHFLKIRLEGNDQNRTALGASVKIFYQGNVMFRELNPYRGFQSSVEPCLYFGLGNVDSIDSLVIRWPRGEQQKLIHVATNQTLRLSQKDAKPGSIARHSQSNAYFVEVNAISGATHVENSFVDFKVQPLLPRMYSHDGPALASGDVNSDGLTDFYLGGAKGFPGKLFLQTKKSRYIEKLVADFVADAQSEDVDAIFFDKDGDGDEDLYVVTGGGEFSANDERLQDKLYENNGSGQFKRVPLPASYGSGSCVRPADIDQDGDLDLFVGGRIVPGRYPDIPQSTILVNDGTGSFSIANPELYAELNQVGMVTDAAWMDLNKDGKEDLIVVGEWMEVKFFENKNGRFSDQTETYIHESTQGFWNCILKDDFDRDGDIDLIIGNYGLNSQIKADTVHPASLIANDFDENSSMDFLIGYFIKDGIYPMSSRDELTDQLPSLKKRFPDFKSYARATLDSVLFPSWLKGARRLKTVKLETTYFQNQDGHFSSRAMPVELQFAPVFSLLSTDVNNDGITDIVSGGNLSATRARTGILFGNTGFIFLGDGNGNFSFVDPAKSGLIIAGDVRHMIKDGNHILMGINNAPVQIFKKQNTQEKNTISQLHSKK